VGAENAEVSPLALVLVAVTFGPLKPPGWLKTNCPAPSATVKPS